MAYFYRAENRGHSRAQNAHPPSLSTLTSASDAATTDGSPARERRSPAGRAGEDRVRGAIFWTCEGGRCCDAKRRRCDERVPRKPRLSHKTAAFLPFAPPFSPVPYADQVCAARRGRGSPGELFVTGQCGRDGGGRHGRHPVPPTGRRPLAASGLKKRRRAPPPPLSSRSTYPAERARLQCAFWGWLKDGVPG